MQKHFSTVQAKLSRLSRTLRHRLRCTDYRPKVGLIDPHEMSSQCLRNNNKSKCCLSVFVVLRHSELDSESHYRHNYAIAGQARNDDKYSEFTCFGLSSNYLASECSSGRSFFGTFLSVQEST